MVILVCNGQWIEVESVEFLDIEENMAGEDVMTFTCPACQETHKSRIYG